MNQREARRKAEQEMEKLREIEEAQREMMSKISDIIAFRNGQFGIRNFLRTNDERYPGMDNLDTQELEKVNIEKLTKEVLELRKELVDDINALI